MTDYSPHTTLWQDFTIAERESLDKVKETYERVFQELKNDYVCLTELVMILNWKIWRWYEVYEELAAVYNELWQKADNYALDNLKNEKLAYLLMTVD